MFQTQNLKMNLLKLISLKNPFRMMMVWEYLVRKEEKPELILSKADQLIHQFKLHKRFLLNNSHLLILYPASMKVQDQMMVLISILNPQRRMSNLPSTLIYKRSISKTPSRWSILRPRESFRVNIIQMTVTQIES